MHHLLKFSLLCWLLSCTTSEPYAKSVGYQEGNQWGDANQWQGTGGKHSFRGGHGQQWQGKNGNFGSNPWSKGNFGGVGSPRSYPSNLYNTPEGYGYDYTIPGADVHFAANRGAGGNLFGRQIDNPWQSQNGVYEKNGWLQKNGLGGSHRNFGSDSRWQKGVSGSNQWPQKNFGDGNQRSQENVGKGNQWSPKNFGGGW